MSSKEESQQYLESNKKAYRSFLSKEEIHQLKNPSNLNASWMFIFNWTVVVMCFIAISESNSVVVTLLALLVMAGRQLGLGILLHECSHRNFFSNNFLNQHIGHWFAGIPLLVPMDFYRPYHMMHHTKTGTDDDPDVVNIKQYPVSKSSMVRKVLRDFAGFSGFKILFGVIVYVLLSREGNTVSMGAAKKTNRISSAALNLTHALIFHTVFFSCFYWIRQPYLYLYWWVCFVFFYPFILRMRQIAEHAALTHLSSNDVRDTTRTTIANWWERLLFAPNFVNYHCEHHYLPTVPSYNLKRMHEILVKKGFYTAKPTALVREGYPRVLAIATSNT
ncbi:TPA: fatty acid desaturase family protein [Vibrio alginolyticus]